MRRSNLLFSAAMVLAGLLAGCSDDLATDPDQEIVDHDQMRYLNVSIVSPTNAGTRAGAGDFQDGEPGENAVYDMYFVFYDKAGKPTGEPYPVSSPEFKDNTDNTKPGVHSIYTSTIPVELNQGDNLPAYVMCFINPINTADFATATLDEIELIKRKTVIVKKNDGNDYFPMSNSAYYGQNPVTGEANSRMVATPISTDQLYKSIGDATTALNNNQTTDIYVERYAARIELTLADAAIKVVTGDDAGITGVNGYILKFVPKAWRPNAIDQELYAVKTFGVIKADNTADYKPDYATLAAKLGNNGDGWWNDPGNFRSYWGCSPSYYDNDYPQVSDDITDVVATGDHTAGYPYELHYFNYHQIVSNSTGAVGNDYAFYPSIEWKNNAFSGPFYARETTTAVNAWQGDNKLYNPLASLASALIVGHYQLTAKAGSASVPAPATGKEYPTFYLYGKTGSNWNLYFESDIKSTMMTNQNVVFKLVDGRYITAGTADAAIFTVAHPSQAVRAKGGVTVAGRLVALQLAGVPAGATDYYYYDAANNNYKKIETEDDVNAANANLLTVGYARKYGDGLCYFNIPIEHLGVKDVADAKNADGSYNFDKCPAGSFGIVRNHAYTINITSIKGLATALSSEYQPVVPPMEEIEYHIAARVNILKWRVVSEQEVEL